MHKTVKPNGELEYKTPHKNGGKKVGKKGGKKGWEKRRENVRNENNTGVWSQSTVFKDHSLSCPLLYCVAVSSVLKGIIRDSEGRNISATRGFLVSFLKFHFVDGIAADAVSLLQTSNGNLLGAVKMADFAILTSDGFGLANNSGLIRRWSQIQFKRNISEVRNCLSLSSRITSPRIDAIDNCRECLLPLQAAVKASGVAVAGFKPGVLQHILKVLHNFW